MGNCQTVEAVTVVIQHPPRGGEVGGGPVERAHGALSAAAVMAANPGHYVAAVMPADDAAEASSRAKKRRLKLLRPDDTLALGGLYRLVTFEEVLREFVSKRHATLSRVVVAGDARPPDSDRAVAKQQQLLLPCPHQEATSGPPDPAADGHRPSDPEPEDFGIALVMLGGRLSHARHGQWRPALPSIAEGSVAC